VRTSNDGLDEILAAILPPDRLGDVPSGFTMTGHIGKCRSSTFTSVENDGLQSIAVKQQYYAYLMHDTTQIPQIYNVSIWKMLNAI
jgi:hypothetical protein